MDVQPQTKVDAQLGIRLSNYDQTEIVVIWPTLFIFSQLAPYPGWEGYSSRLRRDWDIWKRSNGYRKIAHIGLRFINRIDVKFSSAIMEETDYLNFHVTTPAILGPFNTYGVQTVFPLTDLSCSLTINSGLASSPLIQHASFILDLEIARRVDVPQKDDDIFELIELMRLRKNDVFEACITDKARELFNS